MTDFIKARYEAAYLLVLGALALLPGRVTTRRADTSLVTILVVLAIVFVIGGALFRFIQLQTTNVTDIGEKCISNPSACPQ